MHGPTLTLYMASEDINWRNHAQTMRPASRSVLYRCRSLTLTTFNLVTLASWFLYTSYCFPHGPPLCRASCGTISAFIRPSVAKSFSFMGSWRYLTATRRRVHRQLKYPPKRLTRRLGKPQQWGFWFWALLREPYSPLGRLINTTTNDTVSFYNSTKGKNWDCSVSSEDFGASVTTVLLVGK